MIRSLASRLPGSSSLLDAQILLAHITGKNRAWLLSHPEASLTAEQEEKLEAAVLELQAGTPLPYVLGHWEFFGLDFRVTPAVLIPRPETELLVETALAHVRTRPRISYEILDIGTGSGIIPISLAVHIPTARFTATDISPDALQIAILNAGRHGVIDRINFIETDLLPTSLASNSFDIICANLPYIPSAALLDLEIFGKEPTIALDGGPDGLDLISGLLARLAEEGLSFNLLLLEIEQSQGPAASELARAAFPAAGLRVLRDLAGFDRLLVVNAPDDMLINS